MFGLNGIVASHISLSSYEIVFTRTLIGSLFLILIFTFSKQEVIWSVKKDTQLSDFCQRKTFLKNIWVFISQK